MKAKESYNVVAKEYVERFAGELANKPFDRKVLQDFAARVKSVAPLPVLDLGCGPGQVAAFLEALGVPVIGIDIAPDMLREARELHPYIEFREGDMYALDLPAESFAGLVAFYSIIHIEREDVAGVLDNLRRLLIPGGRLLISIHIGSEIRHSDEWWDKSVDLDFVFFEVDEMTGYLAEAGFTAIEYFERDPYPDIEVQTRRAYIEAVRPVVE